MAGFPGFRVAVSLFLVDQATVGLMGFARSIATATGATVALQAQLAGIGRGLIVGGGLVAVGGMIAGGLSKAVRAAADLQQEMKGLQIVTQASQTDMTRYLQTALDVSDKTMFSLNQVTEMSKQMATMGLGLGGTSGLSQLQRIQQLIPLFARVAEILQLVKGVSPQDTIRLLGGVSHQLGMYTPERVGPISEYIMKGALISPGTPTNMLMMGGYMLPMLARVMGAKPEDLLPIIIASQMTFGGGGIGGGRGPGSGAQWANLFTRGMPGILGSGLWKGKGPEALAALGFTRGGVCAFVDP